MSENLMKKNLNDHHGLHYVFWESYCIYHWSWNIVLFHLSFHHRLLSEIVYRCSFFWLEHLSLTINLHYQSVIHRVNWDVKWFLEYQLNFDVFFFQFVNVPWFNFYVPRWSCGVEFSYEWFDIDIYILFIKEKLWMISVNRLIEGQVNSA